MTDCVNCKCMICGEEYRAAKKFYQDASPVPAFGIEGNAQHLIKGKAIVLHYRTFAYSTDGDICPYCCTAMTAGNVAQLLQDDPNLKKNLNNPEFKETATDEEI